MGAVAGVVFDVDDTLYLERDFVASGFRHVAQVVSDASHHAVEELFGYLWEGFEDGKRGTAFNDLLAEYPAGTLAVDDLVATYRSHPPEISLSTAARVVLAACREAGRLVGVLSDGPVEMQQRKVEALELGEFADPIVLTGAWGVDYWKPHPRGFEFLEDAWGLTGRDLVYIGDNPHKDFIAPRRRGWQTIRVRTAGQLHHDAEAPSEGFEADEERGSLEEAAELLGLGPIRFPE